jgi:hypothetical protein
LNGDNNKDFIVYSFGNIHGQSIPYVFISDKQSVLHYRSDIHLYNIKYDPNKKLVKSYYQGGVNSINHKEYYLWQNDSLKLFKGVERNPSNPEKATTTYYNLKNGQRNDYKILIDNTGEIYDTALWKGAY